MKRLILFSTFIILAALLFGCTAGDGVEAPPDTAPETERVINTEPKQTAVVPNPEWGFPVHTVRVLDEAIVTAELDQVTGNVRLTSYNPGETEVWVLDCFDHKAIVKVSVSDDFAIAYEAKPCEEEFINAADYGILPGGSPKNLPDQSTKLQSIIDKVSSQGGGEIFIYPGFYNISIISMREGVTLRMYSGFTDAREGYTAELAEKVKRGEVTVLIKTRILNTNWNDFGRNGASNFTLSGGVIDNDCSGTSSILFGLSRGVTIENMVFKDIKNSHLMQITGCEDITIRNCVIAGFKWGDTFTRETIQIEQSHPGAHNSDSTKAAVRFEAGEVFGCKNITIDSCYFGPSDELPGHHIPIGHHGTSGEAVAEGLVITNNVFDRPTYAAIRFANIVDVEITGNTFISSADSQKLCKERDPAFIILYPNTNNLTYDNVVDGRKTTLALSHELSGTHNVNISDNDFHVGAGSDKRVLMVTGTGITPGANFEKSVLRQEAYDSTPYSVTGYVKSTNYISNIDFCNNKVTYEGQPTFSDSIFKLYRVFEYSFEDNEISLSGCSFKNSDGGIAGMYANNCFTREDERTYIFKTDVTSCYISLSMPGGGEVKLISTKQNTHKIIVAEGGRIEISDDRKGNVTVRVIPDEGYTFTEWQTAGGVFDKTGRTKISDPLELKAIFTKN